MSKTISSHPQDPFFANVELLIIFDGENDTFDFVDYSLKNLSPILNYNVINSSEQKAFRTGSGTFKLKDFIQIGGGSGGDGGGGE